MTFKSKYATQPIRSEVGGVRHDRGDGEGDGVGPGDAGEDHGAGPGDAGVLLAHGGDGSTVQHPEDRSEPRGTRRVGGS